MTLKQKSKLTPAEQSARFIEAAKKTGADESGKPFEKAFKKIVPRRTMGRAKTISKAPL
jgi:hypothetical protein